MEALFGTKFWDNVILEFTHWAYNEDSINKRNFTGNYFSLKNSCPKIKFKSYMMLYEGTRCNMTHRILICNCFFFYFVDIYFWNNLVFFTLKLGFKLLQTSKNQFNNSLDFEDISVKFFKKSQMDSVHLCYLTFLKPIK